MRDYVGYGYGQGTGSPGLDERESTGNSSGSERVGDRAHGAGNDPLGGGGI